MTARNARLVLGYGTGTVDLDGHEIPGVRSLTLNAGVNEITELELELVVREVEVDGEVIVTIADETREVLTRLGWTPPADDVPPKGLTAANPEAFAALLRREIRRNPEWFAEFMSAETSTRGPGWWRPAEDAPDETHEGDPR